jgi:TRAP-type C4-dicarboxylate transport system permease small subunit
MIRKMPLSTMRLLDVLQAATLLFVALALIPAGAHLFELPNKMHLPPDQYMTVQGIYRGWALFGIVIFAALALTLAHTLMMRGHGAAMLFSALAAACIIGSLAIFFMFTYPMNVASRNWTVTPPDFEMARSQWEYSHAVNAVLMLAAFAAIAWSVLASRHGVSPPDVALG